MTTNGFPELKNLFDREVSIRAAGLENQILVFQDKAITDEFKDIYPEIEGSRMRGIRGEAAALVIAKLLDGYSIANVRLILKIILAEIEINHRVDSKNLR